MRVTYRRIGGFAPTARGCDLDSDAMPPGESSELESLIRASRVLEGVILPHIRGADTFTYTLRVEQDGKTRAMSLDQLQVWPELRPLLAFLDARSGDLLDGL